VDLTKPFILIGKHLINVNAIVAVVRQPSGALRILTTATRAGSAYSFIVPAEHAEEFDRQIYPCIAVHADEIEAVEE
jgi:hypothetical protein